MAWQIVAEFSKTEAEVVLATWQAGKMIFFTSLAGIAPVLAFRIESIILSESKCLFRPRYSTM